MKVTYGIWNYARLDHQSNREIVVSWMTNCNVEKGQDFGRFIYRCRIVSEVFQGRPSYVFVNSVLVSNA